jgi:putative chitinase
MLTREIMRKFAPKCTDPETWAVALNAAAKLVGIKTPRQWAHFMAQLSVECAGFTDFEEDLWYSAARLQVVWPKRFPTLASTKLVAGNPKALANFVYNGRMGNRVGTDDGWYFRGRGPKQITGRANYTAFQKWLDAQGLDYNVILNPELLTTPTVGALSAAWFWLSNKLNNVLDQNLVDRVALKAVTRIVNGWFNGLDERQLAHTRFEAVV